MHLRPWLGRGLRLGPGRFDGNFETPTNPAQGAPAQADLPPGFKVRVMGPTAAYPMGYWRLRNPDGHYVDPDGLTRTAWQNGTQVPNNSNLRIYDAGRPTGRGAYGGTQSQIRVSINGRGLIHGTPWGPEGP